MVMVRFICGVEGRERPPLGPFDAVQVTYDRLRNTRNGDDIAYYDPSDDHWIIIGEPDWWSDFIIYTPEVI